MTPTQFRRTINKLGMSGTEVARRLGLARTYVYAYADGSRRIPNEVADAVRALAEQNV